MTMQTYKQARELVSGDKIYIRDNLATINGTFCPSPRHIIVGVTISQKGEAIHVFSQDEWVRVQLPPPESITYNNEEYI